MDGQIALSYLQILDIFFRFATSGILIVFLVLVSRHGESESRLAGMLLVLCVTSYVLLTAPIANHHYGWLRPVFMFFTDCTTYALLAVYWRKVHGTSLVGLLPTWLKLVFACWFVWLAYFFFVEKGIGVFHRAHHLIGLFVLVLIVVDALRDLNDDLVESRRDVRKLAITLIGVYMMVLTAIEVFLKSLKDDGWFSLGNALTILCLAAFFLLRYVQQSINHGGVTQAIDPDSPLADADNAIATTPIPTSTTVDVADDSTERLVATLNGLMDDGFYRQNGLTIAKLAETLLVPQHQLRVVINQSLGFDNFSQFLNSYRIPAICKKLEDPSQADTPILTLALDHGFNSIAPFNRAFKERVGMTPSEYRQGYS